MSPRLLLLTLALLACGAPSEPAPVVEPLDRTAAPRPDAAVLELELDAERTLTELGATFEDETVRALVPARLLDVVEATVELPSALRGTILPDRGLRALGFRGDGAPSLVWAFAVGPIEPALATEPGGPRGARWVTGEPIAIAGDVVVAGPSRALVEDALPYLAFTAMPRMPDEGRVAVTFVSGFFASVLRPMLDDSLLGSMRDLRRSAEAASRAHVEAPALGAPERFVDRLRARLGEWVALLPDLGEARLVLARTETGLRLELDAAPAEGSPLAALLASMPPGDLAGLGSVPATTALAIALRSTGAARTARTERLLADLTEVAGDRLAEDERTALAATAAAWDTALGETAIDALGRTEAGLFALVLGPDARPVDDVLFAPFWSPRRRPYEAAVVALLAGCDPSEPRGEPPLALCADARFDVAHRPGGGLVAAIARMDAGTIAADTLEAVGHARPVLTESPDVARALRPHDGAAHLALALVPSRLLPLLSALEGGRAVSVAPPATMALSLRPGERGHVVLLVTADAASIRDGVAAGRMLSGP